MPVSDSEGPLLPVASCLRGDRTRRAVLLCDGGQLQGKEMMVGMQEIS